ncbi:hypothetical protein DAI22_11g114400 [Oryza sativa Japonica Group]|nr:hypothetical protein DAI22_11g114400 [Oryza sativa Japonica Group]
MHRIPIGDLFIFILSLLVHAASPQSRHRPVRAAAALFALAHQPRFPSGQASPLWRRASSQPGAGGNRLAGSMEPLLATTLHAATTNKGGGRTVPRLLLLLRCLASWPLMHVCF